MDDCSDLWIDMCKTEANEIIEFILNVYHQKLLYLPEEIVEKVKVIEKEFINSA